MEILSTLTVGAIGGALIAALFKLVELALGDRSEHKRWKRDQRVAAYLSYRQALHELLLRLCVPDVLEVDNELLFRVRETDVEVTFYFPKLAKDLDTMTGNVLTLQHLGNSDRSARGEVIDRQMTEVDKKVRKELALN